MAGPEQLLQDLCRDLRLLRTQAGGPSLRVLAAHVGLGKSQLGAILGGRIRRIPDWEVVRSLIDAVVQHARDHGRLPEISLRTGVDEYWKPRYTVLEHALRDAARRGPDAAEPVDGSAGGPRPAPRQLPAPPATFVGRAHESAVLDAALHAHDDPRTGMAVQLVQGMGGIGKTCLALHWAHRNLDRFPDGQLFADLRGFGPGATPTDPSAVVTGFLAALGVPGGAVPAGHDAQVGLYRSLMAGQRMLVLLDNARDAEQVAPLLPGSPTCAVLVTSRDELSRLVNVHGARPLSMSTLTDADARDLLSARMGPHRLSAEPDTAAELVAGCGGLPLALSIVAGRVQLRPGLALTALAAELRDTATRLTALHDDDPVTSLPTVLSWSYTALPDKTATVFGLLGSAPGPDIGLSAAAALTGTTDDEARTQLRRLERVHLIHQHRPDRYRMHDMVHLYAADRARHDVSSTERATALLRLVDFYLHTALAAARFLAPHRPQIEPDPPVAGTRVQPVSDAAAAAAWFEAEHACLLAAQRPAADHNRHRQVWQLAWALDPHHIRRGRSHDMITAWQAGLAAARHDPDQANLIRAYRRLGDPYSMAGRHTEAIHHLEQSLTLARRHGDRWNEANTHYGLALAWIRVSGTAADTRALRHAAEALRLFRELGEPTSEAQSLTALGWCVARLGDHRQGRLHLLAALTLCRTHDHVEGEAYARGSLGYVALQAGHHQEAVQHYEQAVALFRQFDDEAQEAEHLDNLGDAHAALGHHRRARTAWGRALRLYQEQHRIESADRVRRRLDDARSTS